MLDSYTGRWISLTGRYFAPEECVFLPQEDLPPMPPGKCTSPKGRCFFYRKKDSLKGSCVSPIRRCVSALGTCIPSQEHAFPHRKLCSTKGEEFLTERCVSQQKCMFNHRKIRFPHRNVTITNRIIPFLHRKVIFPNRKIRWSHR